MSVPRTTRRTAALTAAFAATACVTAAVLIGLGPAAADSPLDVERCADVLEEVTQWPGTLGDGSTRFSDPYESYVLRQPACNRAP